VVEYAKGSTRTGVGKDGKRWNRKMLADYGAIPDTKGAGDREPLDVYIGPDPEAPDAYVVEQLNDDGEFDEYKVMLGFESEDEARDTYLAHYPDDWEDTHLGEISSLPVSELRDGVKGEQKKVARRKAGKSDTEHFLDALKRIAPGKGFGDLDAQERSAVFAEAQRRKFAPQEAA
jgi:hypothetical protein